MRDAGPVRATPVYLGDHRTGSRPAPNLARCGAVRVDQQASGPEQVAQLKVRVGGVDQVRGPVFGG
jgi:hypothetical protein